ncbi:MAG: RluA family pseudouridine synthase [Candidatus Adiutrix sp.]|jgi:23S rRNA pseudouridine1911/1915/1917 synthase|nr:RluA family pseudouridine synthase [Candidatus Adiutrix sp.]
MTDPGAEILFTVSPAEAGERLDKVLSSRRPEFSRAQLARLIKDGLVRLDGRPVRKPSTAVTSGAAVFAPRPEPPRTGLSPDPGLALDILYEDDHILVVNKPWGLLVHPAENSAGPSLAGGLLARDPRLSQVGAGLRPGLVHRLDRDTSGVLVTAKTEPALRRLAEAFNRREILKRYLAFVRGRPRPERGLVDLPIGRHRSLRHKMAAGRAGGRPALTIYRLLRHFPETGLGLVLLTLVTGRTHQARVHLAALGCPVLADPVYSRGAGDLLRRHPGLAPFCGRQLLHARRLTLPHPYTGRLLTFRAPWPRDFLGLWRALGPRPGRPLAIP